MLLASLVKVDSSDCIARKVTPIFTVKALLLFLLDRNINCERTLLVYLF
jgi:hypothetical protein